MICRNFKIVVQYEGTGYHGWQRQRGLPTVQGALEGAIQQIVRHKVTLFGASRTDAGVHAEGQVASFRTDSRLPEVKLCKAINALLPGDITLRNVQEVSERFHARHDARWKHYRYGIWNQPTRPLSLRRDWHCPRPLNVEPMRAAARCLIGERDFRAFAHKEAIEGATRRNLYAVRVRRKGGRVFLDFLGDGFLYNMIRILTGSLVEVGRGARDVASVKEALRSGLRALAGPTAPAAGLTLLEVSYRSWCSR